MFDQKEDLRNWRQTSRDECCTHPRTPHALSIASRKRRWPLSDRRLQDADTTNYKRVPEKGPVRFKLRNRNKYQAKLIHSSPFTFRDFGKNMGEHIDVVFLLYVLCVKIINFDNTCKLKVIKCFLLEEVNLKLT